MSCIRRGEISTGKTGLQMMRESLIAAVVQKIRDAETARQSMLQKGEDVTEITVRIDNWMEAVSNMGKPINGPIRR